MPDAPGVSPLLSRRGTYRYRCLGRGCQPADTAPSDKGYHWFHSGRCTWCFRWWELFEDGLPQASSGTAADAFRSGINPPIPSAYAMTTYGFGQTKTISRRVITSPAGLAHQPGINPQRLPVACWPRHILQMCCGTHSNTVLDHRSGTGSNGVAPQFWALSVSPSAGWHGIRSRQVSLLHGDPAYRGYIWAKLSPPGVACRAEAIQLTAR